MRPTKRQWHLVQVHSDFEAPPSRLITVTARGSEKAIRKIMRRLERRPGLATLINMGLPVEIQTTQQEPV